MYKLKAKSGVKKRFKLFSGGVKAYCVGMRHKLYKKSKSSKQKLRSFLVSRADSKAIEHVL
ncbi:50S ribosomal protein L35 [Candidatus Hodgkinia cicadicola]